MNVEVEIVATSDLHGWFVPWDFSVDKENTSGSLTYIASVIKEERANNENLIYVDCGDTVQANYVEYFIDSKKNPMVEALNALECDVWEFGNHEYNFDRERRQNLIDGFNGTILSGNVYDTESGKRYLPATTIVERDGVRIGFIGMVTPLITEFEEGKTSLEGLTVTNPLDEIEKAIGELQTQGVDAIVGILHMGLEKENNVLGSGVADIAQAFPQFDAIIAGHAHALVEKKEINGVLVMEPYRYGAAVGFVNLSFEKQDGKYVLTSKDVSAKKISKNEDAELADLMAPYKDQLSAYVNTPIGKLEQSDLSKADAIKGISSVYTESTGIMNLLFAASQYYTGSDAVMLNTDAENAGFPVGDVSIKNISSSYTYSGGEITTYEITGADLKALLEYSAAYFNKVNPGDLTVSYAPDRRESKYSTDNLAGGVTYKLDLQEEVGNRVKDLRLITQYNDDGTVRLVDGKPVTKALAPEDTLLFGTNSYSFNKWVGKGGPLEGKKFEPVFSTTTKWGDYGTVRELTIKYIIEAQKGVLMGNAFNYENWELVTGIDKNSEAYKKAVQLINEGKLELPKLENGRTNVAAITVQDVM
jgi:2',3'-cyclic-nucleotide 2'-phosphodiesterase/3'-nucleotidase